MKFKKYIEKVNSVNRLAGAGFTYRTIARKMRLTRGQVSYILRENGVRTSDYRNGKGWFADEVFGGILGGSTRKIRKIV